MAEKPNILFFMSDEHDAAVTGCYDDPIVHTPNLDALAAQGVTFDDAYTTSPLCVPARLSFTAGKYISRIGAWSNNCWLPSADYPSLPRILNAAGYESYLCGKMHYDRTRRYGFTDLLPGLPGRNDSHKTGHGGRRDPEETSLGRESWERRTAQFHVGEHSIILDGDREVTQVACEFLRDRRADEGPFFLTVGHLAPHFPLIVPKRYYEMYEGRVPMPNVPEGVLESLPTNYKQLNRGFGVDHDAQEIIRTGRELYWALVTWLDEEIGKVLTALERSAVAENTVVIYTSDHGENKGDHGMWWKNNMFEHAARVPMIVRWPRRWPGGQRRAGACSLVDLTQTIAELGGADVPGDWDGDSMVSRLDDASSAGKDVAVSEYYAHNIASGFAMLRRGAYKYVYHTRMDENHGPERELYDLSEDPAEFENLADRPEHRARVASMHAALVEELGREPDEIEQICRADYAAGYGRESGRR
ncbi:MAG: sulfatase-like hydrolase/transferase [Anaerolineae bacterium]